MTDSCSNSSVGSPYGSNTDLRDDDEDLMMEKPRRKSRNMRAVGAMDLDDVETTVRSMQQDTNDIKSDFHGIRNQSQTQKRRILDLENQFEDARVRIDKLLQRKSLPRSNSSSYDSSISVSSPPLSSRSSKVRTESVDSLPGTHKSEININPAGNAKQTFGTVTLTVKVDEE